ncbi:MULTISPECIES: YceI family protein [Tenacibaculum]|uniref:YceI family protein n=1 Tax=Tenacibaculum TaxID=104267 RepID=UPI00089AF981|nr:MULTISPECIES: YceI family protein [unclassified Tenacibaculum]RBW61348.1 YceI family protein [Tenacibaculum sp. E3R01]SEE36668.1 YceI-like domain-containing protein [Tenacibaculum sp. MAR_2010_89]
MKKLIFPLLLCAITLQLTSCKKETKKEEQKEAKVEKKQAPFSLKNADNKVNWTAYKTTEKIPVKGQFKKVNITAGGEGNSAKEALNNAEFSIPVSSIFTSDSGRDFKIKKFFFGIMDKTELLSGKLVLENDSIGYSDITMNNVTKKLPFTYTLDGKKFSLNATMKVSNWEARKALDSLNTICKDLHKGADGVSKTWDEVAINIVSVFK